MQTFLPYADFAASAKALDFLRLGKQRLEALQIDGFLDRIERHDYFVCNKKTGKQQILGYLKHPTVKLWIGYRGALRHYFNTVLDEWVSRGYKNTMRYLSEDVGILYPPWVGDARTHASHRSNLLRKSLEHAVRADRLIKQGKNPARDLLIREWYLRQNWAEDPTLPYYPSVEYIDTLHPEIYNCTPFKK